MGTRFNFSTSPSLSNPNYNIHPLLDHIITTFSLKNDAGLSRFLAIAAPAISKLRHRTLAISDGQMLLIHEITNLSIREIKTMIGVDVPPRTVLLQQAQERAANVRFYPTPHAHTVQVAEEQAKAYHQQQQANQSNKQAIKAQANPEIKQTDYISPL